MLFEKKKFPVNRNLKANKDFITDVKDSTVYQEFINQENPNHNNDCYSLTLNIDGISLCEKSDLCIWPFYFTCNELEIGDRYFVDNTIIAGNY